MKQDVVEQPVEWSHLGSSEKHASVRLWPPFSIQSSINILPNDLLPILVIHKTFCLHPENLSNHVLGDDDLVVLPFTNNGASNDLCVAPEDGVGVVVPGTVKTKSFVPPNLLHNLHVFHKGVREGVRVNPSARVECRNGEQLQDLKVGVLSSGRNNLLG